MKSCDLILGWLWLSFQLYTEYGNPYNVSLDSHAVSVGTLPVRGDSLLEEAASIMASHILL